jgi:ribosomal protein L32E
MRWMAAHDARFPEQVMIMEKKNKPKFNVPNLGFFKSVKARWRKPRGTHNKKRMKFKFFGASPKIGYRNPPSMRDKHPSGMDEVLVNNVNDLENLKNVVLRIASQVGGRKRKIIEEKAKAMNLKVVNLKGNTGKKIFGKGKNAKAKSAAQPAKPAVAKSAAQKPVKAEKKK